MGGEKKWMVDVEDIFGPSLSGVCRGGYLFLLETALDESGSPGKGYHNIDIALKEENEELSRDLRATKGVEFRAGSFDGTFHKITVRVQKDRDIQHSFLDVCRRYEDVILYKVKAVERPPDPGQEPAYFPIPHMDAGLELLGNLQNMIATDGWMSGDSSEGTPAILFELLGAISGMDCYRLLVGNLKKTADLIAGLVTAADC
jgi:hypothetical protein